MSVCSCSLQHQRPWLRISLLPIANKLHAEISRIVLAPDITQRLAADGGTVVNHGPEEFAKIIRAERSKWALVVKQTGFRVE